MEYKGKQNEFAYKAKGDIIADFSLTAKTYHMAFEYQQRQFHHSCLRTCVPGLS